MRIVQVLISYAAAALVGSFAFNLAAYLTGDLPGHSILGSSVLIAIFGSIFALPIAVVVIAVTEHLRPFHWWAYPALGGVGGLLLYPLSDSAAEAMSLPHLIIFLGGACAGLTYWWFAWQVSPPDLWNEDS